jgi:SAM-dependent methyltransferase
VKNAEAFLEALERRSKLLAPRAIATFAANRELCSWLLDPLARWAEAAYGEKAFEDAALGYVKYCLGVAQAQAIYERAGRYTPESMPEITSGVYDDAGYMIPYMWAAILIYAFWPSMISHLALFRHEFLRQLPADIRVTGLDISAPGVAVANRLCSASGHTGRVRFSVADALQVDEAQQPGAYQGVISAMLAEHLPTPAPLFPAISRQLAPDGLVFFSAALESAQRDHVFEFHTESEPLRMAEESGLRASRLVSDASAVAAKAKFLPRSTAMILRAR